MFLTSLEKTKGKTKTHIKGTKCFIRVSAIAFASKTNECDDVLFVKVSVNHDVLENVLALVRK